MTLSFIYIYTLLVLTIVWQSFISLESSPSIFLVACLETRNIIQNSSILPFLNPLLTLILMEKEKELFSFLPRLGE